MSAVNRLFSQCSKPSGWLGRFFLWRMNFHHSKLTDWGLQHVAIKKEDRILDVGCGGGKTVSKLAAIATEGKVYGIDYSAESVAASHRKNKQLIEAGGVKILQESVSHLPFADSTFDLATAVETHYFWPDLPADVREVFRVLKPGGRLVTIAEAYLGGKRDKQMQQLADFSHMAILSAEEHRELFTQAGFSDVQVHENYDRGWICAIGRKPS